MCCKCASKKLIESDTLIMALLFLMTRYSHNQDQNLIEPIMNHFGWLAEHPDMTDKQLKETCSRLQESWQLKTQINHRERMNPASLH